MSSYGVNFPHFDPEVIEQALFVLLQQAGGSLPGQFPFNSFTRNPSLPENTDAAIQPQLGLVGLGASQVENQAQGLEKWLLHYRVLIYLRGDASPNTVPATQLNNAFKAVVSVLRSSPIGERQTLNDLVDNCWIEGTVLRDNGNIDQQCWLMIPIVVDVGL